ncbi:uncharacterized protein K444DRAFT_223598 [Hyaloscypha bicolor E]|uniref:Uncharacterized protein n=1 Tax=Hyaloscypha bicolor E TaxID=1095630 RepID=A0A2J6SJT3_9HELO|nr:uncharacterized protein K444DRAFT_223598 [Hyaloscypha bicolor E]PMD51025.1 hypothetical protein K444DRAFT_223598 [Hyaloscypha bicolor E]
MADQLSETSVPHVSLSRPLPPLPPRRTHALSISIPYRDDPEIEEVEIEILEDLQAERSPPGYEPMYDYLRSQQSNSQIPLPNCQPNPSQGSIRVPYRDQPFIITITDTDGDTISPPPSYHDIYNPNEIEMRNLLRSYELDGTPAEQTEEICRWLVAMLLIALTIVGVGTAFNWGRASCQWPNASASKC